MESKESKRKNQQQQKKQNQKQQKQDKNNKYQFEHQCLIVSSPLLAYFMAHSLILINIVFIFVQKCCLLFTYSKTCVKRPLKNRLTNENYF